ncbi:hypothetical protein BJY00DRAFT_309141 [Aspergillus carlsbadensis]|nr:hypothetical protein BJY00DRAFT_309141 [Aspergillus carlsbadensis]
MSNLNANRRLRGFKYTTVRDFCLAKGNQIIQALRKYSDITEIPLPFTNGHVAPGEEWTRGALFCAWSALLILAINVILTVVAVGIAYTKPFNRGDIESAVLYKGSCSRTDGWKTALHLLINVLSTGLLAASNYVMQCLCAPSRAAVDRAHAEKRWLDIGAMSVRNLLDMDGRRKALWAVLLLSSLPIHMLFNSVVFTSIATRDFEQISIPIDLAPDEPLVDGVADAMQFSAVTGYKPEDIRDDLSNDKLQNISFPDCAKKWNSEFNSEIGLLILVTDRDYMLPASDNFDYIREFVGDLKNTSQHQHRGSRRMHTTKGPDLDRGLLKQKVISAQINSPILWAYLSNGRSSEFYPQHWNYPTWFFRDPSFTGQDVHDGQWERYDEFESRHRQSFDSNRMALADADMLLSYIFIYNPDEAQLRNHLSSSRSWYNETWARQLDVRIGDPTGADYFGNFATTWPELKISHCLIKEADGQCELNFNLPSCLAVISCNIMKIVCMYLAARTGHKGILLTIGDALASFLDNPDVTTKDQCLKSWRDFRSVPAVPKTGATGQIVVSSASIPLTLLQAEQANPGGPHSQISPHKKRWHHAVSWRRWVVTISCCLTCLGLSIFLYFLAAYRLRKLTDFHPLGNKRGIGKPSTQTMFLRTHSVTTLSLIANSPQLCVSTIYSLYNTILSRMLVADEFNSYALHRKPLRVSHPHAQQRSTYYLSIPWRYGIPALALSVVLHWLVSQSIFLVIVRYVNVHGRAFPWHDRACGYSLPAMFLATLFLVATTLLLVALSMRSLESDMPLAAYCSAAISASCHPPEDDTEASLKPVMWGEVLGSRSREHTDGSDGSDRGAGAGAGDGGSEFAHCTFTSKEVIPPRLARFYA